MGKGAVVAICSATHGGAASSSRLDIEAPPGVEPVAVERVLETLPPALVDLALWLADYYGSTPARALALIAPHQPKRRGERREVDGGGRSAGRARAGRGCPSRRSECSRASTSLLGERRRQRPPVRGDGQRQDRGLHPRLRGGAGRGPRRDRARARDRADAADARPLPGALRRPRSRCSTPGCPRPSGATSGSGSSAARRASSSAPARPCSRRFASLGVICVDEEHDASYKQESDPRYDARTVAAKRAALEGAVAIFGSATPRPESWHALERLELGGRIAAPLPTVRRRRPPPGDRLSALGAAPRGARPARGGRAARRSSSSTAAASRPRSTAAPAARRAAASNCDVALTLHGDGASAATTAAPASPRARRAPLAARPSSRASAPGRSGSSASSRSTSRSSSGSGSTPTRSRSRSELRDALERFAASRARRSRRHADGRERPSLRRGRARGGRRRRHGSRRCPTSAPRSGRSSSSPSSPAGAAAMRPGRVIVQTFQPDVARRAACGAARRRGVPRGRARASARARLPAVPPPRPHRSSPARATPTRCARSRS